MNLLCRWQAAASLAHIDLATKVQRRTIRLVAKETMKLGTDCAVNRKLFVEFMNVV